MNTANQVLALHLSGRHDEAVALGRSLLDSGQAHGEQGFAWDHTGPDEPINLVNTDVGEYVGIKLPFAERRHLPRLPQPCAWCTAATG